MTVAPENYEPREAEEYQAQETVPLEANPADVLEQHTVVEFDEPEP